MKSSLPKPFKVIIRIWLTARKYPFSNNNESVPVHLYCFLSSIIGNTSQDFKIYMSNTASFLKERGLLAFARTWVHPLVLVGSFFVIVLVVCVVLYLCVLLVSVLCLVCPMLPFSPDCPFLIASSVFSNVYFQMSTDHMYLSLEPTEHWLWYGKSNFKVLTFLIDILFCSTVQMYLVKLNFKMIFLPFNLKNK